MTRSAEWSRDPWDLLRREWSRAQDEPASDLSVADNVYQVLRGAIVESKLPAGLKLSEQVVADVLEVSRTPVREALLRLTADRFLARDSRGSPRIQGMTRKRISDIYAVRRVLEGLSARLAAQYSDEPVIAELTHLNDLFRRAIEVGDYTRAAHLNATFHEAVARTSHNEELIQLIKDTYGWVRLLPSTTLAHPDRLGAADEHQRMIQNIVERNLDGAQSVAEQHLTESLRVRLAMLFDAAG